MIRRLTNRVWCFVLGHDPFGRHLVHDRDIGYCFRGTCARCGRPTLDVQWRSSDR